MDNIKKLLHDLKDTIPNILVIQQLLKDVIPDILIIQQLLQKMVSPIYAKLHKIERALKIPRYKKKKPQQQKPEESDPVYV